MQRSIRDERKANAGMAWASIALPERMRVSVLRTMTTQESAQTAGMVSWHGLAVAEQAQRVLFLHTWRVPCCQAISVARARRAMLRERPSGLVHKASRSSTHWVLSANRNGYG